MNTPDTAPKVESTRGDIPLWSPSIDRVSSAHLTRFTKEAEALANPNALDFFRDLPELKS